MYPHGELIRLAAHKATLRRRIALSRAQCGEAAGRAIQPLAWLDRVVAFFRQLSPLAILAAVPAGLVVQRAVFPHFKLLGTLVRWGPPVFALVRGLRAGHAASPSSR
jgi:hypothetical protein